MEAIRYPYRRTYALIAACIIYAIVLLWLLFDIKYPLSPTQAIQLTDPPLHSMRSKGPAPVRFMAPPKAQQQPSPAQAIPTPPQQLVLNQTTQTDQSHEISKTEPPKAAELPAKKNIEPSPVQPTKAQQLPRVEQRKIPKKEKPYKEQSEKIQAHDTTRESQKIAEPTPRYQPRSRDKNKWFKNRTAQKSQPSHTAYRQQQPNLASQFGRGLSNYINKQKKVEAEYSVPDVRGNRAESLEYEMFAGSIVRTVCNASHSNPLTPHSSLVQAHTIIVKITCDRNRTITNITFIQPSYDNQLNHYLKNLIESITPPQLPSVHRASRLTIPLQIKVARQYHARTITLTPA